MNKYSEIEVQALTHLENKPLDYLHDVINYGIHDVTNKFLNCGSSFFEYRELYSEIFSEIAEELIENREGGKK